VKVIHVLWSAAAGGIETLVYNLLSKQQQNPELQPELLIGRKERDVTERYRRINVPVHQLEMKSGSDISVSCYRKAAGIFINSDIIHFHSFNPLLALAARNSGRKIIYTEHGNFGFGREKEYADVVVSALLKRFLNTSVAGITFNSPFTMRTAMTRYGLRNVRKEVIYNGTVLNVQHSHPADEIVSQLKEHFVIVCMARLATVKRIDRLLKVFSSFSHGKDTKLLIAGDGPLKSLLQKLAGQLEISNTTIFAGYVENARQYLEYADVTALTSVNEAFGLAAVESWAAGKPVVVFSDGGGLADLVAGFCAEDVVQEEEGFVHRLSYYYSIRGSDEAVHLASRCREYSKAFDIAAMEKKVFRFYNER
jgi:glycosyltransferase involved in cell wall biosynthesis